MSFTALALIVGAAFIHAYWNFLVKRAAGSSAFVWLFSLGSALIYAPLVVVLLFVDPPDYGVRQWALIVASGFLHLLYAVSLNHGYRLADLSVVYPVARGTGPLISSLGAIVLLGERPALIGFAGIGMIVIGIFLLASGPAATLAQRKRSKTGLYYGVLTGLCIATYTLNDAYAVKVLLVSPILLDYFGNAVRLAFLTPSAFSNVTALRDEARRNWKLALAVGALMPLSYVLVLFAMRLAPVSYVAPARELSMLIGAFFGAKLLREGNVRQRVIGGIFMVAGITGLALA